MRAPLRSIASRPVTVFLVVRHDRLRAALWSLLESEPGVAPIASIADAEELLRLLHRGAPAVAVVDESVLGERGIGRLPELVAAAPQTAFLVVGMYDHPAYAVRARDAGAVGYVCLDEAERLGRRVLAASTRSTPLVASRRRTGSRAVTVVP